VTIFPRDCPRCEPAVCRCWAATNPADGASVVDRCGERLGCGSTAVQLVAVIRHHPCWWSAGSAALLERCGGRAWALSTPSNEAAMSCWANCTSWNRNLGGSDPWNNVGGRAPWISICCFGESTGWSIPVGAAPSASSSPRLCA
jgi:hypothetical protein